MTGTRPSAFTPPPYPYERLKTLTALTSALHSGVVDLSIGTPCDAPPEAASIALAGSTSLRGYPLSAGSDGLRRAGAAYLERRFGVTVAPSALAACVGTKEFVASAAWYLRLRHPERDTVLGPAVAYPTYEMSATLAGCRYVALPTRSDGAPDLDALDEELIDRSLVLWVNSPANPSGAVFDLSSVSRWAAEHDVVVCSDECYAEFTWDGPPATVLSWGDHANVLAVHSLSKRSNFAGARVGFYAGDPQLVTYLSEVRKHAGLMVPGPVQEAAIAAFGDDGHVERQRHRYRHRLSALAGSLDRAGVPATLPAGSFYLWVPVPQWAADAATPGHGGDWVLTEALATVAGMLVSPGEFYGDDRFVRIALVVPDAEIERVGARLDTAGPGALEQAAMAGTVTGAN
ncbi:MAG: aminotransferase class I/II-fold pyridoxal phosphate-dependent enzyme [Acidimicrobiales bacterium]